MKAGVLLDGGVPKLLARIIRLSLLFPARTIKQKSGCRHHQRPESNIKDLARYKRGRESPQNGARDRGSGKY